MKATEHILSCGAVYYAVQLILTFESVDEILKCDNSNEGYWGVLFCGAVCCLCKVIRESNAFESR